MAVRKRTPKDDLWDAICAIWPIDDVTKADRSRLGKLVKDFLAKGATAKELRSRHDRYRQLWPDMADVPEALLKHWKLFKKPAEKRPYERPETPQEKEEKRKRLREMAKQEYAKLLATGNKAEAEQYAKEAGLR